MSLKINADERIEKNTPWEILLEEFLLPLNIAAYRLSKDIDIPQTRISEIVKGKRRITVVPALRLSKYFENSAKIWLGLQDDYDLEEEQTMKRKEFESITPVTFNAA